jgi:5-methylcytosine-specific restriction protein A
MPVGYGLKMCRSPLCNKRLGEGTYCDEHERDYNRSIDRYRGTSASRGYDYAWRKVRELALKRDNYLCVMCAKQGRAIPARDVDHIKPFKGKHDPLRLDLDNLQSLCQSHHSEKTARENGGFGNTIRANTTAEHPAPVKKKLFQKKVTVN